jgi:hypothetical protein
MLILQGFPNEEVSQTEVLDMVHAVRSSENVTEDNIEEWLQTDACELGFQQAHDRQIPYLLVYNTFFK